MFENSLKDLYHSEKLFNSIRSGCVTFYVSDPELKLPHLDGAYVKMSDENILKREELSQRTLNRIGEVMYSGGWDTYSFKSFFDRIIESFR